MDKVDYYSKLIMNADFSDDEWLALEEEINEWLSEADDDIIAKIEERGSLECLDMICSGIRWERVRRNTERSK